MCVNMRDAACMTLIISLLAGVHLTAPKKVKDHPGAATCAESA